MFKKYAFKDNEPIHGYGVSLLHLPYYCHFVSAAMLLRDTHRELAIDFLIQNTFKISYALSENCF